MRKFLLPVVFILLSACTQDKPSPTQIAVETIPTARVNVSEALVFAHPSREAPVIFRLIEGDQLPILTRTRPDMLGVTWYQVGQGDLLGWIAGSQVSVTGDISSIVIVTLPDPTALPSPTPDPAATPVDTPTPVDTQARATISIEQAVILEHPAKPDSEVTRLYQGEVADIIGRSEPDAGGTVYYLLAWDDSFLGWVPDSAVDVTGDLVPVPLVVDAFVVPTETSEPTAVPTATLESTPDPNATPAPAVSPEAVTPTLTPVPVTPTGTPSQEIRQGVPPPLEITLPEGWQTAHILLPINTAYIRGDLAVSLYQGPLNGGLTGSLWILWGFPNVTGLTGEVNLYGDGVQLLRGVVLDPPDVCTIGLGSDRRTYMVGGREAVGTIYAASPCSNGTDIAGFFAVLQVSGGNFAFFVGVEPVEAVGAGVPQMQAILDSVIFTILEPTPEGQAP